MAYIVRRGKLHTVGDVIICSGMRNCRRPAFYSIAYEHSTWYAAMCNFLVESSE